MKKGRGFIAATGHWEEPLSSNYMPRLIGVL
jgi:hypothetical protein